MPGRQLAAGIRRSDCLLDEGAIDGQVRFDDEIEMTAGNRNHLHFREQAIPSE
jgi:hypothetical protein